MWLKKCSTLSARDSYTLTRSRSDWLRSTTTQRYQVKSNMLSTNFLCPITNFRFCYPSLLLQQSNRTEQSTRTAFISKLPIYQSQSELSHCRSTHNPKDTYNTFRLADFYDEPRSFLFFRSLPALRDTFKYAVSPGGHSEVLVEVRGRYPSSPPAYT